MSIATSAVVRAATGERSGGPAVKLVDTRAMDSMVRLGPVGEANEIPAGAAMS